MKTALSLSLIMLTVGPLDLQADAAEERTRKVIANPAKDIFVIVDKDSMESFVGFFQRRHILVGAIKTELLVNAIGSDKPLQEILVIYSSQNDNRQQEALYGQSVTLTPLSPDAARLVKKHMIGPEGKKRFSVTVVLERASRESKRYRVVGVMTRHHVGFFGQKKRVATDEFAPTDLRFQKR